MSWISENYEKAALGGAALITIGLGVLIWSSNNAASSAFDMEPQDQNDETRFPNLTALISTSESFNKEHEIVTGSVNGRSVGLFTSVPVFVNREDVTKLVDLETGAPIHEGVPNSFWLNHGINPGFENTPQLDPDSDGFSNLEECKAGTDPLDAESFPNLVMKLTIANVETSQVHIKGTDYGDGGSTFRLEGKGGKRLNKTKLEPIQPGKVIPFTDEIMKNRFKFVAFNPSGMKSSWEIEDLKPNKKGTMYTFNRRGNMLDAPKREFGIMDSVVEFDLKAIGQDGKTFKIEENNSFSLPFNDEAKNKPYLFKSIDLNAQTVLIEYRDKAGKVQTENLSFKK